jgi:hypothetical protein
MKRCLIVALCFGRSVGTGFIYTVCSQFQGTIKDVHAAVVNNDKETFQKRTADPVPNQIFISKDQNGLNPLHKVTATKETHTVLLPHTAQTSHQFCYPIQTKVIKNK